MNRENQLAQVQQCDFPAERLEYDLDSLIYMLRFYLRADVALLSIIDDANDRQIFRAHSGLMPEFERRPETPLSHSFCLTVRNTAAVVVVEDARFDERFHQNPAIDRLGVISYLGVPVYAGPGAPVGAACAISARARRWQSEDIEFLEAAADQFSALLGAEWQSLSQTLVEH